MFALMMPAIAQEGIDASVQEPEDIIFQSSASKLMNVLENNVNFDPISADFSGNSYKSSDTDPSRMPFFKQIRLRSTYKYRQIVSRDKSQPSEHKPFWRRNEVKLEPVKIENDSDNSSNELLNSIDNAANIETSDVSLEAGISEENVEKQLLLDASNINYDNQTGQMVATGRPILFLPPQNTKVIADKMTYDDQGNILNAEGNVVTIRDGKETHSDYLVVNLNEETIDADNIFSEFPKLNITAEHGTQQDGLLIFKNGKMYSDNDVIYRMSTQMVGPKISDMIIDDDEKALFFGQPNHAVDIKVKSLEIDARKNHDVIKAKGIKIGHNDKYFFKWPSITMYTNKEHDYFEGNYPELGSQRKIGMFAGPGLAFSGPFGSVLKVIPMVTYKNGFGFGGMVKYVNKFNRTEFGYSTRRSTFVLRGRQQLDDDLYLHYAYNNYVDEWFTGARMPKYIAEIVYNKGFMHRGFLGGNRDMTFSHRASFGFMKDDDENTNDEHYRNNTNFSTTRTKYMAQIYQTLYHYANPKTRVAIRAGVSMQGSAAIYGSGDTQFIGRVGPNVRSQYKNWIQSITYYLSGYQDGTPMPHFDAYRYGSGSLRLSEALRINKYITVAWQTYINLTHDAPNKKTFQENAFLVSLGPDDFKVVLGYDFIRERTYFGVDLAFNPKGTTIKYDKMVIKNPERLGKESDNGKSVAYIRPVPLEPENKILSLFDKPEKDNKVLQYAEVIELEDPDKERID